MRVYRPLSAGLSAALAAMAMADPEPTRCRTVRDVVPKRLGHKRKFKGSKAAKRASRRKKP